MAECLTPYQLKEPEGQTVPCGKCPACYARRASAWSFRLMQQHKVSTTGYFLTLTYDTDHVPISPNGFMSLPFEKKLNKKTGEMYVDRTRDVRNFMKRLRKLNAEPLRYYYCGEYGGTSMRPHYHMILFNASLQSLVGDKLAFQIRNGNILLDGKTNMASDVWSLGHLTIGELNEASVGYTLQYMSKGHKIPMHRNDDRTPEFSMMSKGWVLPT